MVCVLKIKLILNLVIKLKFIRISYQIIHNILFITVGIIEIRSEIRIFLFIPRVYE